MKQTKELTVSVERSPSEDTPVAQLIKKFPAVDNPKAHYHIYSSIQSATEHHI
jgi:hypothetical protein